MAKYREIILKDGRKVFIDNKGNIVESGTFQQSTGEDGDTNKQSLASLPVDNNNIQQAKVDLLNIDLGDSNKSDGSAVVETPVENTVRTTPATPRRRTASTSVRRTQTSTPVKVVDKRNNSTVTVTATSKTNPSKLPEVTVVSTRTPKDSTKVDSVKTDSIKTDSIKKDSVKTAEERKQILTKKKVNTSKKVELPKHTQRILNTQSKQGLSGADPIGQFYVESVLGSKILKGVKSGYKAIKESINAATKRANFNRQVVRQLDNVPASHKAPTPNYTRPQGNPNSSTSIDFNNYRTRLQEVKPKTQATTRTRPQGNPYQEQTNYGGKQRGYSPAATRRKGYNGKMYELGGFIN